MPFSCRVLVIMAPLLASGEARQRGRGNPGTLPPRQGPSTTPALVLDRLPRTPRAAELLRYRGHTSLGGQRYAGLLILQLGARSGHSSLDSTLPTPAKEIYLFPRARSDPCVSVWQSGAEIYRTSSPRDKGCLGSLVLHLPRSEVNGRLSQALPLASVRTTTRALCLSVLEPVRPPPSDVRTLASSSVWQTHSICFLCRVARRIFAG